MPSANPARVTLRSMVSDEDLAQCETLERAVWGHDFPGYVSAAVMKIAQKVGGVVAGAVDADDRLLGFVFGFTGVRDRELLHWSHMLAVREEARDLGLGRRLKLFQRDLVVELGVERMQWTFDPLEARNAHLNLMRLGARVVAYRVDAYGPGTSVLHRGIGTDRFVVDWRLTDPLTAEPAPGAGDPLEGVNVDVEGGPVIAAELPNAPRVRVEVPSDVQAVRQAEPELARRWRESTRHAFLGYLERGYHVESFLREPDTGRCYYIVVRETS